jgi:hypothetical protein
LRNIKIILIVYTLYDSSNIFDHESLWCNNYNCDSPYHKDGLEVIFKTIIDYLHNASAEFLFTATSTRKCVPGWNDNLKLLHEDAKRKFHLWKINGKIREGTLADDMRKSRSLFKRSLKKCRDEENNIRDDKLIRSFKNKNKKHFWNQINKIKNTRNFYSSKIDNETEENKIAEKFSRRYKNIFDDKNCQNKNKQHILNVNWVDAFNIFNAEEIKIITKDLKNSVGPDLIHINHLKFGTEKLFRLIAKLFNAFLMHNYLPKDFIAGIITPIVKNENSDLNDINNYRPIMMSSIFLKIFEVCLLNRIKDFFIFNDRQHGFRENYSTSTAIFTLKETIHSYLDKKSTVYASFLDIAGAFDKVNHGILMNKLISLKIPNVFINIISFMYENQYACVKYKNSLSNSWNIKNGVRQGGVLSPFFFSCYIDEILEKISTSGKGTKLGLSYSNIIAYADDLVLISPSVEGLQFLLNLANNETNLIGLKFNPKKCAIMKFGRRSFKNIDSKPMFQLDNVNLKQVEEFKYLGVYINSYMEEKADIIRARNKFFNSFNSILRKFDSKNEDMLSYLFKSYCLPMYGSDLWISYDNCSQIIKQLRIGYHKSIKKIYKTSYKESNHVICNEKQFLTFDHYINFLKVNTIFRLLQKPCKFISINNIPLSRGVISRNIGKIFKNLYGIDNIFINDLDSIKSRIWRVQLLEDSLR